MKKTILGIILTLGFIGFGQAAVLDDAVSWIYNNGLTIFKTTKDYKPNNPIRRDEAAKLFVKFATLYKKADYIKTAKECKFSDLNDAHADLKDIVVESCRMGIFQGSAGRFMPRGQLTNEQAVAVLVRILHGNQSEIGVSSRSENYYKKANEMGLLSQVRMNDRTLPATRGNVGIILAVNSDSPSLGGMGGTIVDQLTISELSIRLPLDPSKFTYKVKNNSVRFSSKQLQAIPYCEYSAGGMTKYMGKPTDHGEWIQARTEYVNGRTSIKQFNGFFFLYTGPQEVCNEAGSQIQQQVSNDVLDAFQNMSLVY